MPLREALMMALANYFLVVLSTKGVAVLNFKSSRFEKIKLFIFLSLIIISNEARIYVDNVWFSAALISFSLFFSIGAIKKFRDVIYLSGICLVEIIVIFTKPNLPLVIIILSQVMIISILYVIMARRKNVQRGEEKRVG